MKQWVLLRKGADFQKISERFGISPRLASLIRNREIIGEEQIADYLHGTLSDLFDGMFMKDMDKAVDLLREKLQEEKRIRIIGDYDIDGVNATYILLEALQRLGANVDSDIPHRIEDGYGLNLGLLRRAHSDRVDTIITCDNGIAAYDEIAWAKELGMTVIVTDHHEVPFEETGENGEKQWILPPADAVIDPKRADCSYPFQELCGAAVAYKFMEALYESLGREAEELDDLIENVAIATIGDVMDLVGENRIFVKEGLAMLPRTRNQGLKALMECTGLAGQSITAYHIGFVLGPCLNAGGRLDTAKRALNLLLEKDPHQAAYLASALKHLNDERKAMTQQATQHAIDAITSSDLQKDPVFVLYLPDCHESLAGIVAGRIREKYYRPTFVLTDACDGIKGSGRSIPSYHMYDELHRCRALLQKYGGHALAAGFSTRKEMILSLREQLNTTCTLTEADLCEKVLIDMELPFSCVTEEFVKELALLEPFGKGNQKPIFAARNVRFCRGSLLGKNRTVLKMQVEDASHCSMDAVYFGDPDAFFEGFERTYGAGARADFLEGRNTNMTMSITFYPKINEYMGRRTIQLTITNII